MANSKLYLVRLVRLISQELKPQLLFKIILSDIQILPRGSENLRKYRINNCIKMISDVKESMQTDRLIKWTTWPFKICF